MACQDIQKQTYLYLSGELGADERLEFRQHLNSCDACRLALAEIQPVWDSLHELGTDTPGVDTRDNVLAAADRKAKHPAVIFRTIGIPEWIRERPVPLGLVASVVCMILIFLFLNLPNRFAHEEPLLAWEDDFISHAYWLDSEIDRVSSGNLLVSNHADVSLDIRNEGALDEDWISSMSYDLFEIRSEVEDLENTLKEI